MDLYDESNQKRFGNVAPFPYLCIMNSEQYLNYLQESQHIALESYNYIGEMYNSYMTSQLFDEYLQLQRDEKIEEILN